MRELPSNIAKLSLLALLGYLVVALFLGYWQVIRAPALRAHPYNDRARQRARTIEPGQIYTSDGQLVLGTHKTPEGWVHTYPTGEVYAHLTGYNYKTGLQWELYQPLFGLGKYENTWRNFLHGHPTGLDITLTVDGAAQATATQLMRGKRGAVVALEPYTGAILVLVSAPSYDPAEVLDNKITYEIFRSDPNSPELNRALQGLYPPGSVFKIFTVAAALDAGAATAQSAFTCAGSETVAHTLVKCRKGSGHGRLSLSWALADSCNIAFAKLGQALGPLRFRQYVKKFHLLDRGNLVLPSKSGKMADVTARKGERELAQAAFGQGATLLTPLAVARLTATIANGGQVVQPYLVASMKEPGGRAIYRGRGQRLRQAISAEIAAQVEGMMVVAVEKGTAREAAIRGVEVAAKAGSAQNPHGPPHSWTVALAPAGDPQVVVVVVVENGGAGGEVAGPIAREVLKTLLQR